VNQHAFIVLPIVLKKLEVGIIERGIKYGWIIVVDFSESIKLVLRPVPLIGQLSPFIVQPAESIHLVIFPLSLVVPSILIIKFSPAVAHAAALEAFVSTSSFIFFDDVLLLKNFV
jgi:hypothetical protein